MDESFDNLRDGLKALGTAGRRLLPELEKMQRALDLSERRIEALDAVNHLTTLVARIENQEDVDEVLFSILSEALKLSRADRGIIVITDEEEEDGFSIRASCKMDSDDTAENDLQLSRSLIQQILERGEGVVTTNVQQDDRFQPGASLLSANIRSVLATPIKLNDQVVGGLYVDSQLTDNLFNQNDLVTLSAFGNHAAVALTLATSIKERRELHEQSVLALVNAVEAADAYTAGHSYRVSRYAKGIAEELGLPAQDTELVTFAGYLHDVGKIALQTPVNKDGPLTDEEWEEMKRHPIFGERILRNSPALHAILPAVRSHHERWTGGGYPDGISGQDIHPYARMIAVADSFDAMTTNRSYRKAFTVEHALQEIRDGTGSHYEPAAARAFISAYEQGVFGLPDEMQLGRDVRDSLQHAQ